MTTQEYRQMLKIYMDAVSEREGVFFLCEEDFTPEQYKEMSAILDEVIAESDYAQKASA
jgi:hypothetical protein